MRALGILIALAVAVGRAEDRPPAPDSMAAAKSDLAALAATAAETPPAAANARSDAPPAAAPAPRLGTDPARAPGKGANWLLEAMNAQTLRPSDLGDGADSIRAELDRLRAGSPEGAGAKEAAKSGVGAAAEPPAVVNPLDAFMDGWISAHDKALLLPEASAWPLLEGLDPKAEAGHRPDVSPPNEPANPYLAGPGPVPALPEAAALNPAPAPELPGPSLLFGPDPRLLDGPKLDLPDFAQPTEDDKYFRQMKRF
jgi:hypothetical protein